MVDTSREEIIRILMERDGNTEQEAKMRILECIDALESGNDNAIAEYLGLEDDYIFGLI